jgi:hypothetical protein
MAVEVAQSLQTCQQNRLSAVHFLRTAAELVSTGFGNCILHTTKVKVERKVGPVRAMKTCRGIGSIAPTNSNNKKKFDEICAVLGSPFLSSRSQHFSSGRSLKKNVIIT